MFRVIADAATEAPSLLLELVKDVPWAVAIIVILWGVWRYLNRRDDTYNDTVKTISKDNNTVQEKSVDALVGNTQALTELKGSTDMTGELLREMKAAIERDRERNNHGN